MTIRKNRTLSLMVVLLFVTFSASHTYAHTTVADMNVYDCTKGEEDCEQDSVPTNGLETEDGTEAVGQKSGMSVGDYVRALLAFAFVIGLLFFLLKFVNRKNRLYDRNRLMKNMGGISLGQHKSIQLVVIGDTYYLIGVGEDIRLLKEITDPTEIERLKAFYEEADSESTGGLLERMIATVGKTKSGSESSSGDATTDFSKLFNTRLAELKEERKKRIRQVTEKERNEDD